MIPESPSRSFRNAHHDDFGTAITMPRNPHLAQPDGGRDAISYVGAGLAGEFLVFQVKFVRNPLVERDPHRWITEISRDEAPKVKKLIPRGAREYYLLTNVPGTGHLDAGSIDRVNRTLNAEIGLPSFCWWRNDLNRRLDNAWDLKWAYPEILTGLDVIRFIFESGLSEDKERRSSAIRALVEQQYRDDYEVRFKQVDLQNKLLELFVDVPILMRHDSGDARQHHSCVNVLRLVGKDVPELSDPEDIRGRLAYHEGARFYRLEYPIVGAASALLHRSLQSEIPSIVLEGAPGQGKSTIVQYVCQVHRMRLLNKVDDLAAVPAHQKSAPIRIPFKVDLRDLATWIARKNPFSAQEGDPPPPNWRKSLESFLAALVEHHSGGATFSVDDLLAVGKLSSILLVFDGLDEVADISTRKEVVEEITRGVNRLQANAASLQVVVTSRPAAFANSPGFSEDKFPYFHLGVVTRALVDDYADKWFEARRLPTDERLEIKAILSEKLSEPHVRELARNPMQLAILLSLIHTRGVSLPDKRTALYDLYIELFFSREATKNAVVREHRDLLIDIHRYLAWVLHSEAEQGRERSSISSERLNTLLCSYLSSEGRDTALAGKLFTSMVERVVALVSRVQGTYEFEVQSLREYFAARFLYDTAPYSPPGAERRGTKPDRFDAIVKNFYWLNVARFFAGCSSKGELPSLVDRLQELTRQDGYRATNHPRVVAAMLLSDWVFAQHPKSVRDVLDLLLDDNALKLVVSTAQRAMASPALVLPNKCGKQELLEKCFNVLQDDPPADYASDLTEIIKANATSSEIEGHWMRRLPDTSKRTDWMWHGLRLGVLSECSLEKLTEIFLDSPNEPRRLRFVFMAGRQDFLGSCVERWNCILDQILDKNLEAPTPRIKDQCLLDLFSHSLSIERYTRAFAVRNAVPLWEAWKAGPRRWVLLSLDQIKEPPTFDGVEKCKEFVKGVEAESQYPTARWATELLPWDRVVETGRSLWGDRWAFFRLANAACGVKSITQTCADCPDLLDQTKSLCRRARYARLRSGNIRWWRNQFAEATTDVDRALVCLVLLTWGTPNTLIGLVEATDALLNSLTTETFLSLIRSLQKTTSALIDDWDKRGQSLNTTKLPLNLSERSVLALAKRVGSLGRRALCSRYLKKYQGSDLNVLELVQEGALDPSGFGKPNWSPKLPLIAKSYSYGVVWPPASFYHVHYKRLRGLSPEMAAEITGHADRYPAFLLRLAEETCRANVASRIVPVAEVARKERWFDQ
jgi:hypothetical protein